MNLVPLLVIFFPHERPRDRDMGADRWDRRVIGESPTGGLGVRLRDLVMADDLEHKIPTFVRRVPGVDEICERRINLQPTRRIPVPPLTNALGVMRRRIL